MWVVASSARRRGAFAQALIGKGRLHTSSYSLYELRMNSAEGARRVTFGRFPYELEG